MPKNNSFEIAKYCCLTFDLEPDCGGRFDTLDSLDCVDEIVDLVRELDVSLTIYVTGRIFECKPQVIEAFASLPRVEFGVHAYSHRIGLADSSEEIRMGIEAYRKFFGRNPFGYRAPQGRISKNDLAIIKSEGVNYDSSVFPACLPGRYYNLFYPNYPFRHHESGLLEIPITALWPFPIPLGLGYLRLLGKNNVMWIFSVIRLPNIVVIVFHLHDLILSRNTEKLSGLWKWFYRYNVHQGKDVLCWVIEYFKKHGYAFHLAQDIAEVASG